MLPSEADRLAAIADQLGQAGKIAEAIDPRHYQTGFHSTATCGTFAAAATAAFNTWHENAKKIPTLFTAPPPADAKSRALPKIWENKSDCEAKAAALAKAASEGKHSTLDELKASFPNVQQACANCHDNYRRPAPPAEGKK